MQLHLNTNATGGTGYILIKVASRYNVMYIFTIMCISIRLNFNVMKINAFSVVWNKYETKDAIICPKNNKQHYVEVCERCPYFKWFDVAPERVNCNFDKGEPYEPINKDCNELEPQYYFDKSTNNFLANEAR